MNENDVETIDEVKARLVAKGLLSVSPRVVVPKAPRREQAAPATPDPATPDPSTAPHWAASEADEWDVEPGVEESTVRCPQCRGVYIRALASTRLTCPTCERAWRFAVCAGCDELALTRERQESWACGSCRHTNRSWWRTPEAARVAQHVVARRRNEAVAAERRAVREGMRKRRWKLVALAVWAAVAAVAITTGVRMAEPSSAAGTKVACARFDRLRSDLASGTVDRAALDVQLAELHREAQGADPAVERAAVDLRAAPGPSTSEFLVARTALADACTRATR